MTEIDIDASVALARAEDLNFTDLEAEVFRRFLTGEFTERQASVHIAESMGAEFRDRGDQMPRPVSDAITRFLLARLFHVRDTDGVWVPPRGPAPGQPAEEAVDWERDLLDDSEEEQ